MPRLEMNYYDYMENRKEIWEQLWYEYGWQWIELRLNNWDEKYRKIF